MGRLEYRLASLALRLVGWVAGLLPIDERLVVLASARSSRLEGNLAFLDAAIRRRHPELHVVHLLEPYSYGFAGKLTYLLRLARGMTYLRRARLFIVDNAYLPIHVAPHRAGTTVVQVWHAVGALKRFGADTVRPLHEPERTFLHRYYDAVVVSAEAARVPYAAALRTPVEHVLALGTPRSDVFADEPAMAAARERLLAANPSLRGRTVVLYAPTFRGRGRDRWAATGLDGPMLRAALPADHGLVLKTHPNVDPALTPTDGFDVVADPEADINDWLALADVLITDYSSSINEYAVLGRPIVLLTGDLDAYERDPGLYLDYRTDMIGVQVVDTTGVIAAVLEPRVDTAAYRAYVERHAGRVDGHASDRFVDRFLEAGPLKGK